MTATKTIYRINARKFFYGRKPRWISATAPEGGPLEFDSREEAQAWISEADAAEYHQSNNEYGRPEYKIKEVAQA